MQDSDDEKFHFYDETIDLLSNNQLNTFSLCKIKKFENKKTFKGHSSAVNCVAVLPNGNVISGSTDGTLKVWDIHSRTLLSSFGASLKTLRGHMGSVYCVAVLPNGNAISGSEDETLKVWDVSSGACLRTFQRAHRHFISCVAVLPNGNVISSSWDNKVRVWDINSGVCLQVFGEPHYDSIRCVAILPNGNVITGSGDDTLKVWDPKLGVCLQTLKGHISRVTCLAVHPNGNVISGSLDKTLKVWDINTGTCLQTFNGHTDGVRNVTVLPNGRVISGSVDNTIKIWDTSSGSCLHTVQSGFVSSIAVLPNGHVISGSNDKTLTLWAPVGLSLQEQKKLMPILKNNTSLTKLELSNVPLQELSDDAVTLVVSLLNNKKIEVLELINTGLTDSILNNCIPSLLSMPLKKLNLSENKLTHSGIKNLFEKLYKDNDHIIIQEIILSGNLIEAQTVDTLKNLYNDCSRNEHLMLVDLSGNFILSPNRERKLIDLLTLLLKKSELTAGEFLKLRFHELKETSDGKYFLSLKKEDDTIIEIELTHKNIQDYNELKNIIRKSTESAVFKYMISHGIKERILEINQNLKAKKYIELETQKEKSAFVKQLADYHPDAPLKSYINTHSIFCHSPFIQAQSLLCAKHHITYETGRIYLLAKKPKGQLDEHAMIAYELINGYNQRFFKVAHLTTDNTSILHTSLPKVSFFIHPNGKDIYGLTTYLQKKFFIASFSASRKQIKNMHASIMKDAIKLDNTLYSSMVISSVASKGEINKQIKNCFTWALDKIKDHAGYEIKVDLSMFPSKAVKWLINNPGDLYIPDEGSSDDEKNENENCLMM